MAEPVVSVCMITYNHAPFIAKSIEGVLQQRSEYPFELVIGEDCSTDGTREIVERYQRLHPDVIRVITSEKNVGSLKNAVRARKACRGKYIAFCEGDDYWHHPEKLQKQVAYMENHPECGLVCSNYDVNNIRLNKLTRDFVTYKKWRIPEQIDPSYFTAEEVSSVILTCTVLFRRELYERIVEADPYLHESDKFMMGDIQVWAEMSAASRITYIPESLVTYHVTEESATRSRNVTNQLRFSISMSELNIYLCDKYNMPESLRNMHEDYWCESALRLAMHQRNRSLADEAKRRKRSLDYKDWIRYYGAKHNAIYRICMLAAFVKSKLTPRKKKWYE